MIAKTYRLEIDKLTLADAPFILKLLNEPSWLKYIGNRGVKNLNNAQQYIITGPQKSYQEHGFGLFKVSLLDDTPIGICGLLKRDHLDHPDIGFAFLQDYSGKGYALEAAKATLDLAKQLQIKKVLGITMPENTRSIMLLEKLGMKPEGSTGTPGNTETLFVYST